MDQLLVLGGQTKLLSLGLDVLNDLIDVELSDLEESRVDLHDLTWVRDLFDWVGAARVLLLLDPLVLVVHHVHVLTSLGSLDGNLLPGILLTSPVSS